MEQITQREAQALNLLNLVKSHKNSCNSQYCDVSLSLIRPIYEKLVERKCTDKESEYFF